jgi:hypothetical protein
MRELMLPDDHRELHPGRVDEVARLSPAEVVSDLVGILGPKRVAAIGDVKETRLVQRWIEDKAKPQREQALRTALQAARVLHDLVGSDVARAWFVGCNQHFEMQSPISVLRAANESEQFTQVLRAAFEFAHR